MNDPDHDDLRGMLLGMRWAMVIILLLTIYNAVVLYHVAQLANTIDSLVEVFK